MFEGFVFELRRRRELKHEATLIVSFSLLAQNVERLGFVELHSAPRIRSEKSPSSGGAKRHRQSVQGTHTASDPGATTRKRADSARAPKRFIALAIPNLGETERFTFLCVVQSRQRV